MMKTPILAAIAALLSCAVANGQAPGTGAYPFSSFDNRGFDSVNLGNLNTRFSIPIVSKAGRGLPFNYTIQYEGLIWDAVSNGTTVTWTADPQWGFTGALNGTALAGYLTWHITPEACVVNGVIHDVANFSNFVYHDSLGGSHSFNYAVTATCPSGSTVSGDGSTSDGSGYTLLSGFQVQTKNGAIITPGSSPTEQTASNMTDSNGNEIDYNGSGGFTDTTGMTPLSISGSNPVSFTYPVANQSNDATTATATLTYRQYTVRTNFGCSGIGEYGSNTVNLVDHITLADGSTYSFTYEGTPGATDGAVTGRLASITLPTGGVIGYQYTGGCGSGGGSGILGDGSVATLARTTSDGVRSYVRGTINSNAFWTQLVDEKGNQTYLAFTTASGNYYETDRQVFQGAMQGTPLMTRYICYAPATAPCDGQSVSLPFYVTYVTQSYNGGSQAQTDSTYDSSGDLLTTWTGNSNGALEGTQYSYNSGTSVVELGQATTTNGAGDAVVAQTTYGYDETTPAATSGIPQHASVSGTRGNVTSVKVSIDGTANNVLTTTTAYYDTGQPVSTTTPNGTTTYGYDPTQTFATQTTLPTPSSGASLSTSAQYDTASGALLTSTGMNAGQTTTVNNYDSRLRPTTITRPNGGQIAYAYASNQTNSYENLNLGTGEVASADVQYDGYGRPNRQMIYNGTSPDSFYQTDTCYDATGLTQFVSVPYQSTGSGAEQCSGAGTSYAYDALGRTTSITTGDGTKTIQYNGRAVETADVNGVTKIVQYDLLGRISGVCEVTSASVNGQSPGACGMDIAGTGFVTSYTYNLAAHSTTVTQGANTQYPQTRSFTTDAAGRTTSVTEPERGNTTYAYTYNGAGLLVTRTRPSANQTGGATTQTSTQYDSLGRIASIGYNDGSAVNKNFYYDVLPSAGWAQVSSNALGQLAMTSSGSGGSLAETQYSYDSMGNVVGMWECGPSTCGQSTQNSRALSFGYDLGNNLTLESDGASGAISYGVSPAGQVTSIVNNTYQDAYNPASLVSNVVNGPFGPASYSLGNGLTAVRSYDSLGRNAGDWVCAGSAAPDCAGGSQLYGNAVQYRGSRVIQDCDTIWNECANTGFDGLNRMTSLTDITGNPGDIGSYTYSYDIFGNRLSQTAVSGSGPSPSTPASSATNQLQGIGYDAAGNQTGDGISHSFTYDAEGNVIAVDGGNTARYVYDALNHRVASTTAAGSYEYLYDAEGRRTSTWLTSGNFGEEGRIYWGGMQVAFRARNGQTFFDHQDYLGSERMRTDYQGSVALTERTLAFGDGFSENVPEAGSAQDNSQFASLEYDAESGTQHAQFRQYTSTPGRWISPDPYDGSYNFRNPQSFNRYSYALNRPLSLVDPSGLDECDEDGDCASPPPPDNCDTNPADSCDPNPVYYLTVNVVVTLIDSGPPVISTTTIDPWDGFDPNNFPSSPASLGGGGPAPNNNQQTQKPAWDANLPNCWAVGVTNLGHAIKSTLSPLPSVSTGVGAIGGGGDLIVSGTKAVSRKAGVAALLAGFDWNLASGILSELENPTPCR